MPTIILEESALCEWCDMFQTLLHFGCWVLLLLLSLQASLSISMMIKIRYSNIIGKECVKLALDLKHAKTM